MSGPAFVLDATALVAYITGEGHVDLLLVEDAILAGAVMSSLNWSETLAKVEEKGAGTPRETRALLLESGILGESALRVLPFDEDAAVRAAELRLETGAKGLGLGDRACLELARRLALPAVTIDCPWFDLDLDALGLELLDARA